MSNPYAPPNAAVDVEYRGKPTILRSSQLAFRSVSGPVVAFALLFLPLESFLQLEMNRMAESSLSGRWIAWNMASGVNLHWMMVVCCGSAKISAGGAKPSIPELLRGCSETLSGVLAAYVLTVLWTLAGFLLFVVPGFHLAVALSFGTVIAFDEPLMPLAACQASRRLVKGRFWTIAVFSCVWFGPFLVLSVLLEFAPLGEHRELVQAAVGALGSLALALSGAAFWFYYRDCVTLQGFDVHAPNRERTNVPTPPAS